MDLGHVIMVLIIGGLAGWIAGLMMRGGGFGILGNIAVGIVGAFVGGWIFDLFDLAATGFFGNLIMAVIGAVVLLAIVGLLTRGKATK